ncbi:MAG TPA: 3-phosphoshikimate 1-carboxyvinyltransferase [Vicinamibacterales bacterium]|nr:3-phosphoshikimate 1-carboxyvinyltransferase [Vicinamibacterales bacterium]
MSRPLDITPARTLRGTLEIPGDKSISHRYALLGALAEGTTSITHLAPGADVQSTLACLHGLGVDIDYPSPLTVRLHGRGFTGLETPSATLDAGNSGTTMRLLAGILAGCSLRATIGGDESLSRRPMKRVIEPLTAMGARIDARDGHPPLTISGGSLKPIRWRSPVASAQVKSAVLLAGLRAHGRTTVEEAMPTRDHTERAFPVFGLAVTTETVTSGTQVSVDGGQRAVAPRTTLIVPGDPSSAAVWAAAAAARPGSSVELRNVCLNPSRLGFLAALERMGALIEIEPRDHIGGEPIGVIRVSHGGHAATSIDAGEVPGLIDELPVLAARAALGGGLDVTGAGELRVKESDRISALVAGFRQLGVDVDERPDGFVVHGARAPEGGTADAAGDHRLVMAFTIVGLGAAGPSRVTGADVVGVSYPGFERDLARLVS